jgi:hypothetical protein
MNTDPKSYRLLNEDIPFEDRIYYLMLIAAITGNTIDRYFNKTLDAAFMVVDPNGDTIALIAKGEEIGIIHNILKEHALGTIKHGESN